jgi:hypothetical protein
MSETGLPYAESVNYWKTSSSSPDKWMERARREIEKVGGVVIAEGFGSEPQTGRAAYMLVFEIGGDQFKITWPVLPSKGGHDRAARVQATTLIYREVKARCISAAVLGARVSFFAYLMLPDGRVVTELESPEWNEVMAAVFTPQLTSEV